MGGTETAYDSRMMTDQLTDRSLLRDGLSPVALTIPCRPGYVALCRLVAGALGTRDSLAEDVVSDIRVIVTEACNCFLAMNPEHPGPRRRGDPAQDAPAGAGVVAADHCAISMEFDSQPDKFIVSVLFPGKHGLISWLEGLDPVSEAGLGLTILKALTDEMVELDGDEGTVLRLTKRLFV